MLFEDISSIFCKTADESENDDFLDGIQSRVVELHEDLYSCVDVQAFSCLPKNKSAFNPLQYVVSFNPRLLLVNYTMAPLAVFEIDPDSEPKEVGQLNPQHA
jgi:hypothetical protein